MKRTLQTAIALLLALLMILSLAACGKQGGEDVQTDDGEHGEFVYTADYKTVKGSSSYMNPQVFTEDGFYVTTSEKVGTNVPEGATIEYEGQYDVYEPRLYFVGKDGSTRKLTGYEPLPSAENTEGYAAFYSGSGINGMALEPDGNLVVVENCYTSYFTGPESQIEADNAWQYWEYSNDYYIRVLDTSGKELSQAKVDYDTDNSYLDFLDLKTDGDGNLLAVCETQLVAFRQDGSIAYTITGEEYITNITTLKDGYEVKSPDGKVVLFHHDAETDSWTMTRNGITTNVDLALVK